jgi:hypothetical protein
LSERIIEVTVSPTGETKIETRGFAGSSCRDASAFLEKALGQQVSETLTGEFYQQSQANTSQQQQR